MTITYYPFDAGSGAAVYELGWTPFARLFSLDGVAIGKLNELEVYSPVSGMTVKVKSGQFFIQGHFMQSDAEVTMTLTPADGANPRWDSIAVQVDWTGNTIGFVVKTGVAAGSPVPPTLTRSATYWEVELARIYVGAGVASIALDMVFDVRPFADMQFENFNLENAEVPLSGYAAAGRELRESSGAGTAKPTFYVLLYDPAAIEARSFRFLAKTYPVTPRVVVGYRMASANVGKNAIMCVQLACVSPGDPGVSAKVYGSANSKTFAVPSTADVQAQVIIDLTTSFDDMTPGDNVQLLLWRNATDGADTADTGDLIVDWVRFLYD